MIRGDRECERVCDAAAVESPMDNTSGRRKGGNVFACPVETTAGEQGEEIVSTTPK